MGEPHYPFTGPTIDGRNLSDDAASRNNIYVSIEASYTHGKAMSHYGQSRATYIYRLMIDVAADRRLDYDPRIKTRSYEKPPLFRRDDSYLQQDYRHQCVESFEEIEKNVLGTVQPNMIGFSGVGPGISYNRVIGIVRNVTSYGEYIDCNGNSIVRENCATAMSALTRYRPITGRKSSEAKYLSLGEDYCIEEKLNQFVRTTVRLKRDQGLGSDVKNCNVPLHTQTYLMPSKRYITRDVIPVDSDGGRKRAWPRIRSKDSRYIYSSITYTTRFIYASETGICGTMLRAIEETQNAIVSCPEQHRTGEIGLLCDTGRKGDFCKLHLRCYACAQKIRTIDGSQGNLYSFSEEVIGCMSQVLGYRTEGDYKELYTHAVCHYTLNPDEVSQEIFKKPEDLIRSSSMIPQWRQRLIFVCNNTGQRVHLKYFQDLCRYVIGETYSETSLFHQKFIRFHGGYGGHSRVVSVVDTSNLHCGPGQIMLPCIEFDCGGLTGEQFLDIAGRMGITSLFSRPQVGPKIHVRRECDLSRYLNNNLASLMWVERLLQSRDDRELNIYREMKRDFLLRNIYL